MSKINYSVCRLRKHLKTVPLQALAKFIHVFELSSTVKMCRAREKIIMVNMGSGLQIRFLIVPLEIKGDSVKKSKEEESPL